MNAPKKFEKIVKSKRYSVESATLLAHDAYWDGNNFERSGRNMFLYMTPNGAYFTVALTQWQGEQDMLTPISREEAVELYEGPLSEHEVEYAEAFPWATIQDA
jgi:hypothetical protein